MKERPILFSGENVRAILDGRKTQTRRIVRELPGNRGGPVGDHVKWFEPGREDATRWCGHDGIGSLGWVSCPYGVVGDRLWVRETFAVPPGSDSRDDVAYRADLTPAQLEDETTAKRTLRKSPDPWTPSIFMPRWASRITLEITEVRVQRLQEITPADACDEGAAAVLDVGHPLRAECYEKHGTWTGDERNDVNGPFAGSVAAFATLWDSINGQRAAWSSNPWVWAISFRRLP